MPIAQFTPKAVADLFKALAPEDQKRCLDQIGFTAEGLFLLLNTLDPQELHRFTEMIFRQTIWQAFPWMIQHAIKVVKEHPGASDEELHRLINEETKTSVAIYQEAHTELAEARLKEQRDRKSDPETIKQDAEIHRLRTEDPKKWSWKRLGKQFGMSKSGAQQAFKRHESRPK